MVPLLKAAATTDGVVNNPAAMATHWTTEIAFPISKLLEHTHGAAPKNGGMWRINVSRVEWKVVIVNGQYQKQPSCQSCPVPGTVDCDNWSWSPQHAVAMHKPEVWGFLQFSDGAVNGTAPVASPEWEVRYAAVTMYYALHAYAASHNGTYTASIALLLPFVQFPELISTDCTLVNVPEIVVMGNYSKFEVTVSSKVTDGMACKINNKRRMTIL